MTVLVERTAPPSNNEATREPRETEPLTTLQKQLREIRAIVGNSHHPLAALARLNDEPIEQLRARGMVYARTLVTCSDEYCAGSAFVDVTIAPSGETEIMDSSIAPCRPLRHSPPVEKYQKDEIVVDSPAKIGRSLLHVIHIDKLRRTRVARFAAAKMALRQSTKSQEI